MRTARLRKIGDSVMMARRPGADGRLVVAPHKRRGYTLAELLAQCNPKAPRAREVRDWVDDAPVGGELI